MKLDTPSIDLNITLWTKQWEFVNAEAFEVLYGGAAGGGKSHAQLIDALLYALKYPESSQLVLRRTFRELDMSLIRKSWQLYPRELANYNSQKHEYTFYNGSIITFGYLARDADVMQYMSAEFDVVRFDELTHFTEYQYTYMISRIRGTKGYPKHIKSSTNPGNVGHAWVKKRFIDPMPPNTLYKETFQVGKATKTMTRIFIPARVADNGSIVANDPDYIFRLEALPEAERRALRDGDWNVFEGQYFTEFSSDLHVCEPFPIPPHWRRYRAFDYGLDRLACVWAAVDPDGNAYIYREYCRSDLNIARAAAEILAHTDKTENIYVTLAPRDIWSREQVSGRSKAQIFAENGLPLVESSVDREAGWLSIKELLDPGEGVAPKLHIFKTCTELISCLPMLLIDPDHPTDCMTEPHEITHAPDALRYFCVWWHKPSSPLPGEEGLVTWADDQWDDYYRASNDEKVRLIKLWGKPKPRR